MNSFLYIRKEFGVLTFFNVQPEVFNTNCHVVRLHVVCLHLSEKRKGGGPSSLGISSPSKGDALELRNVTVCVNAMWLVLRYTAPFTFIYPLNQVHVEP